MVAYFTVCAYFISTGKLTNDLVSAYAQITIMKGYKIASVKNRADPKLICATKINLIKEKPECGVANMLSRSQDNHRTLHAKQLIFLKSCPRWNSWQIQTKL